MAASHAAVRASFMVTRMYQNTSAPCNKVPRACVERLRRRGELAYGNTLASQKAESRRLVWTTCSGLQTRVNAPGRSICR